MLLGLFQLLGVKPDEQRAVVLLLLFSFFDGLCYVLLDSASSALFLSRFSAEMLPYVYVLATIVSVAIGVVYTRLVSRIAVSKLMVGSLFSVMLVVLGFALALMIEPDSATALYGLVTWREAQYVLTNVVLGIVATKIFDLRQGKRLLGLVVSGDIIALIIGGFTVSLLVDFMGARETLFVAAGIEVITLFIAVLLARSFAAKLAQPEVEEEVEANADDQKATSRRGKNFVRLMIVGSVVSSGLFYFFDYAFFDQVEIMSEGDETRMMTFLGMFFGILGIVKLIFNAFFSGMLRSRLGVAASIALLPIILVAGSAFGVLAQLSGFGIVVGWSFIVLKLIDEVFRQALVVPGDRILVQALPMSLRQRVQSIRESIAEPSAIGLAGLGLLLITLLSDGNVLAVVIPGAILALIWLAIVRRTGKEYRSALTQALNRRELLSADFDLSNPANRAVVERGLKAKRLGEVLFSLSLLERNRVANLGELVAGLLHHANPEIQVECLALIERTRCVEAELVGDFLDELSSKARENPSNLPSDERVRGRAARTLCALLESDAVDRVAALLRRSEPWDVRREVLVGLIRYGGIDGVLTAGNQLTLLVDSEEAQDRAHAAEVLGETQISNFYRPLIRLLADSDRSVKLAALEAARKLGTPRLVPYLLELIADSAASAAAVSALAQLGEESTPGLAELLASEATPINVKGRAIDVASRLRGDASRELLLTACASHLPSLRGRAIAGLAQRRPSLSAKEESQIAAALTRELAAIAELNELKFELVELGAAGLRLSAAIDQDIAALKEHVIDACRLLVATPTFHAAVTRLRAGVGEQASVLEVIDMELPTQLRSGVLSLIEAESGASRHTRTRVARALSWSRMEDALVCRGNQAVSPWTVACGIELAVTQRHELSPATISRAGSASEGIVREAVTRYERARLNRLAAATSTTSAPRPLTAKTQEPQVLTIEKVLVLKSIDVFSNLPEDLLVSLAESIREIEV